MSQVFYVDVDTAESLYVHRGGVCRSNYPDGRTPSKRQSLINLIGAAVAMARAEGYEITAINPDEDGADPIRLDWRWIDARPLAGDDDLELDDDDTAAAPAKDLNGFADPMHRHLTLLAARLIKHSAEELHRSIQEDCPTSIVSWADHAETIAKAADDILSRHGVAAENR